MVLPVREGHTKGHTANGPWNVLFTFAVNTGYFQDRLLPSLVVVYDFGSNSGALLPQVSTASTTRSRRPSGSAPSWAARNGAAADSPLSLPNSVGADRNRSFVENGLSAVRQRDEVFLRIRYTF